MSSLDIDRVGSLLHTEYVGRAIAYTGSVVSTMAEAQREAEGGAPEGVVALADEQTGGRGRQQRSWVSPPGVNLYFTVVLRPTLDQLRHLALIAPLAVCEAIEETTGLLPRIKWPNDVMIEGRKVAGILVQVEFEDGAPAYALVGIGVNVNLDAAAHAEIASIATSLRSELGREVGREEVLAATLDRLETHYKALQRGEVVSIGWKQRLETLGQPVRLEIGSGVEEGTAVDADSDGSLILRRDDGSHVRIDAGEVLARS